MGQKKFRRMVPLFFHQGRHAEYSCVKSTSDSEDVSAFYGIVSLEGTEAQSVHTKGCREVSHRREDIVDLRHLALHIRIHQHAGRDQKSDGKTPDQKWNFL